MKIPLLKIVGRPIVQQSPMGMVCLGYEFVEALKKLGADPLPVKDRYALARTLRDVEEWVKAWQVRRDELLAENTVTRREFLTAREKDLQGRIKEAETCEVKHPVLASWRASIERVRTEMATMEGEGERVFAGEFGQQSFNAALENEQRQEVEIFLDHKIRLGEDSKLTGGEIATLIDLVEVG